jgi:hypothetical protein
MLESNRFAGRLPIFLNVSLLKGVLIRPIISILKNVQDFEVEDQGIREMAEKIAQTLQELNKGNGQEGGNAMQAKEDLGIRR